MLAVLIGGLSMVSPFSIDTFFPAFHAMEKALKRRRVEAPAGDHGLHGAVRIRLAGARPAVGCGRSPAGHDLGHGAVHRGLGRLHVLAELRDADRLARTAGRDRRRRCGHRPRHHPRSVRRRRGAAPHEPDHHDLRPRAGGGAHHRRLGARGVRLARGVRRHGGVRRGVLAGLVVETAGDASAAGTHPVQRAQSRGDLGHGAAPSRNSSCCRWPRPSTSARSRVSSAPRPRSSRSTGE